MTANFQCQLDKPSNCAKTPKLTGGEMYANAGMTCSVSTELRTKKSIQPLAALPEDSGVSVIPDDYLPVCDGKEGAAKMLSQIVFKYQPKPNGTPFLEQYRHGAYWLAFTLDEWAAIGKCRKDQARYRLEQLEEMGLIEVRCMKYKGTGVRKTNIRLLIAEGAASIKGRPDIAQMRMISNGANAHLTHLGKTPFNSSGQKTICYIQAVKNKQEGQAVNIKTASEKTPDAPTNVKPQTQTPAKEKQPQTLPVAVKEEKPGKLSKAFEMPSAELRKAWEKFEQDYILVSGEDCIEAGWPKPKLQALQRFEFQAKEWGYDPLAFMQWLTPTIWQSVALEYWDDPRPNTLYLKSMMAPLLVRYHAALMADVKTSGKRVFKRYTGGVRSMRYRLACAAKKSAQVEEVPMSKEEGQAFYLETLKMLAPANEAEESTQEAAKAPLPAVETTPCSEAVPQPVVGALIEPEPQATQPSIFEEDYYPLEGEPDTNAILAWSAEQKAKQEAQKAKEAKKTKSAAKHHA